MPLARSIDYKRCIVTIDQPTNWLEERKIKKLSFLFLSFSWFIKFGSIGRDRNNKMERTGHE